MFFYSEHIISCSHTQHPRRGPDSVKTSHGATVKRRGIKISVQTDESSPTQHLKHNWHTCTMQDPMYSSPLLSTVQLPLYSTSVPLSSSLLCSYIHVVVRLIHNPISPSVWAVNISVCAFEPFHPVLLLCLHLQNRHKWDFFSFLILSPLLFSPSFFRNSASQAVSASPVYKASYQGNASYLKSQSLSSQSSDGILLRCFCVWQQSPPSLSRCARRSEFLNHVA